MWATSLMPLLLFLLDSISTCMPGGAVDDSCGLS
jgi:hypothetical protein